jgi:hypothetical protein
MLVELDPAADTDPVDVRDSVSPWLERERARQSHGLRLAVSIILAFGFVRGCVDRGPESGRR